MLLEVAHSIDEINWKNCVGFVHRCSQLPLKINCHDGFEVVQVPDMLICGSYVCGREAQWGKLASTNAGGGGGGANAIGGPKINAPQTFSISAFGGPKFQEVLKIFAKSRFNGEMRLEAVPRRPVLSYVMPELWHIMAY